MFQRAWSCFALRKSNFCLLGCRLSLTSGLDLASCIGLELVLAPADKIIVLRYRVSSFTKNYAGELCRIPLTQLFRNTNQMNHPTLLTRLLANFIVCKLFFFEHNCHESATSLFQDFKITISVGQKLIFLPLLSLNICDSRCSLRTQNNYEHT